MASQFGIDYKNHAVIITAVNIRMLSVAFN